MKIAVIGLGVQGKKRAKTAGEDLSFTVDPFNKEANYRSIDHAPLEDIQAAFICTSDAVKPEIIEMLLKKRIHLLVEKPFFDPLYSGDERKILDLKKWALQNNIICYTAYNHRFEPHIQRLKEVIESGALGKIYMVKGFYGNGTARNVRESDWRDKGHGVLGDLAPHLLDTYCYIFEKRPENFEMIFQNNFENRSLDHALVVRRKKDDFPAISLEMSLLSYKNRFQFEVLGELGSLEINGLCKWGPSEFSFKKRIFPSGRPIEEKSVLVKEDPTWELEYSYFKDLCEGKKHRESENEINDYWIHNEMKKMFKKA